MLDSALAAVSQVDAAYATCSPFHPNFNYPEYRYEGNLSSAPNRAYQGVREVFRLLGNDEGNFDTPAWNPLKDLVQPGDHVVLKPNLIRATHPERSEEWEQVLTHPSVIRAVLDYVQIALQGRGRITIADGPQTDSDFAAILKTTRLDQVVAFSNQNENVEVELLDLRRDCWIQEEGITKERIALPGDPKGYTTVDLANDSEFAEYGLNGRFYGADYDITETAKFHSNGSHTYILCRTVMDADVVINIPKMKTHKKTGVTLSLKNMVGINGYRNCLPHHTIGTPDQAGDEFPESTVKNRIQSAGIRRVKNLIVAGGKTGGPLTRLLFRLGGKIFGSTEKVVRSGNWYGNDTTWRMVLDLNKCLFNYEGSGDRRTKPLRYMSVIDGIVAGHGDGPVFVDAHPCGVVLAGYNPLVVDNVTTLLMGFDDSRIRSIAGGWRMKQLPLAEFGQEDVVVRSSVENWSGSLANLRSASHLAFRPHFGWQGNIERDLVDIA